LVHLLPPLLAPIALGIFTAKVDAKITYGQSTALSGLEPQRVEFIIAIPVTISCAIPAATVTSESP